MAPSIDPIRGALTQGSFDVSTWKPEDWDKNVYNYMTNGDVPITAITDRMATRTVKETTFKWAEMPEDTQTGAVTGVYTDAARTVAYAGGGTLGQTLYLVLPLTSAKQIFAGNYVTFLNEDSYAMVTARVESVVLNGAASYLSVKLLHADSSNALLKTTTDVAWLLSGDVRADHSELPEALAMAPTSYSNQTEIMMAAIEASGTEMATEKYVDVFSWAKQLAMGLQRLRTKIERSYIFGRHGTDYVGAYERRSAMGLIEAIETHAPTHKIVYPTATGKPWSSKTWRNGAQYFLDWINEELSRTSKASGKEWFVGNTAFTKINQVLRDCGDYEITTRQSEMGFAVTTIVGFHQDMRLIRHPEMSRITMFRNAALITEAGLLQKVILQGRGLKFIDGKTPETDGYAWVDGKKAGWMIEKSLQWNNLDAMALVLGLGDDSTV